MASLAVVPTPSERRALLFVAAVAALGLGVRGLRSAGGGQGTGSGAALAAQMAAVDSAVAAGGRPARRAKRATRATAQPIAPVGPVDVDRADATELDRLPGIGPALAQRIVDDRELRGAFGSLERLQDVRGIGPALAARLAPLVTFSGPPRASPEPKPPRNGLHP